MSKAFSPKELADFWAGEASVYESQHDNRRIYPMQAIRNHYIRTLLGKEPRKHLDAGCGPGYTLIPLMKDGWKDLQGLDISEEMLSRARHNMEEAGLDPAQVPLQVGNIEALPFEDEEFESVACVAVVEYLQQDEKALAELSRVLKPGGTLVMAVRNKRCLFRLWDAFRFMRSRIRTLLNCKKFEGMSFKDGNGIWYKKHGPVAFKNALRKHSLEPADERYFHYYVTPVPVENVLGRVGARIAVKLECLTRNPISMFLASGYIVKAVKQGG